MKPTFFETAAGFHAWLEEHHRDTGELLVGFYKKKAGRGITYAEALDEALAFGWIDGVRKGIDMDTYSIRFTPRRAGSVWSAVNIRRAAELAAEGRMRPAGLSAFAARDERKAGQYSYEREHMKLDPALEAALRANRKAASFVDAQPPGYRRIAVFWVMSAKREETRRRRMSHLIERSNAGARIDLLKPGGSGG